MTIKELFEAAVEYDESLLAHTIILLLREGKISLQDEGKVLDTVKLDVEKIKEAVEENELGINPIKLYSLKMDRYRFAWIFAQSSEQATSHFINLHGQKPMNCIEFMMDWEMEIGDRTLTFREYRNEQKEFPCFAGYYDRRDEYLWKFRNEEIT